MVHGLLGTGPHSNRCMAGEQVKLCSHYCLSSTLLSPVPAHPGTWKNCLKWTERCIYIFLKVFCISSDIYPELELLGHKAILFLIFWGTSILFSVVVPRICISTNSALRQGYQTPGPRTGTARGTRLHSKKSVVGKQVKLHPYLQPLPIAHITTWAPPPVRSAAALDSHRSLNPTVNYTCEGSRLHAPYENLMLDHLRWSWGSDASTW